MRKPVGTILIADDDANDVELIQLAFLKLGVNNLVQVCRDGEETLAYMDGRGRYSDREKYPLPFIVILDWTFLFRSGLEVLRGIRSSSTIRNVCVAILSSSVNPQDKEAALKAGADLFLQKPISGFADCVRQIVDFWDECEERSEVGR